VIVLLALAIVQFLLYRLGDYYQLRKGRLIITLFFILGNIILFPVLTLWIRDPEHDEYGMIRFAVFGFFWILGNIATLFTLAVYSYGRRFLKWLGPSA
jgi:ABC-type amino acid transport system permease subunit